jgi:hypothetical protein
MPTVFVAIDFGLHLNDTDGDTYSEIIRQLWWQIPILGIAIVGMFGVLAGHWFKPKKGKVSLVLALIAGVLFTIAFLAGQLWW